MTPVMCCGFECGVEAHFSWFGTGSFETTIIRSGLRSRRFNPTASTGWGRTIGAHVGARHIGRFYIRFDTLPSADTRLASFGDNDSTGPAIRFKQSDSKIYAAVGATLGSTGVSVTTGQFYLIDYDFNVNTGGADFCDGRVDGVALGQATATGTSTGGTQDGIGIQDTCTANVYIDDVLLSDTAADYPLGAGKILSFVPNADGTHTFTTTVGVRGTTGAPTGGGNIAGSTDSYQWLNARPIGGGATDSTRLWNQQTNASTLYGEVQFEDTIEVNPPRAVQALVIQLDFATGTGDSTFKLNDNGTESTIFATGAVAGVTTDTFRTKQFATAPSTGAAWTLALFNGLRFRFGYSADANPDHYCRGVMIEAEFPESLAAEGYGSPFGEGGQRLMTQLLAQ